MISKSDDFRDWSGGEFILNGCIRQLLGPRGIHKCNVAGNDVSGTCRILERCEYFGFQPFFVDVTFLDKFFQFGDGIGEVGEFIFGIVMEGFGFEGTTFMKRPCVALVNEESLFG